MHMKPLSVAALSLALAGCVDTAGLVEPAAALPAAGAAPAVKAPAVPGAMQWLYGSGESAASTVQAYRAFTEFVRAEAGKASRRGVVLAPGATLEQAQFLPCGDRPTAVVLDVDETAIQNLGYEYDEAYRGRSYDAAIWDRWERTGADRVAAVPGVGAALEAARAAGVTVVFNSNRLARNAAQAEAALAGAGLGPARHGETLFLKGDDAFGSDKDARRQRIAGRYCVIAMVGDQLGDFSDLFNADGLAVPARRAAATAAPFASLWGAGWFMLANPVYGPSIRGSFDDVFPADRRWTDLGE